MDLPADRSHEKTEQTNIFENTQILPEYDIERHNLDLRQVTIKE